MSLAEQIAREHRITDDLCNLGLSMSRAEQIAREHKDLPTVTEQAVRERVAEAISEVMAEAWDEGYKNGYRDRRLEASYEPGTNPYRQKEDA